MEVVNAEVAEVTVGSCLLRLVKLFEETFQCKHLAVALLKTMNLPEAHAKAFYERYKEGRVASVPKKVPKLSDLCIKLIATKNEAINTLFEIYGPATNFSIRKFIILSKFVLLKK